jgi:hypothetical protein
MFLFPGVLASNTNLFLVRCASVVPRLRVLCYSPSFRLEKQLDASRCSVYRASLAVSTSRGKRVVKEDFFRPQSCCTFAQYWKMDKVTAPICVCGAAVLIAKEFVKAVGSAWTSGMWRGRGTRQVCALVDSPGICRMSRGSLFFFFLETFDARDNILQTSRTVSQNYVQRLMRYMGPRKLP